MIAKLLQNYTEGKRKYLDFLLSFRYDFFVWKPEWHVWFRLREVQETEVINSIQLHREILPQEWVFDIDAEDWEACYELAVKLEEKLNDWKIPFNRWSSGNFLHYHVFIDDNWLKQQEVKQGMNMKWYKTLIEVHFDALKKSEISIEDVRELMVQTHRAIALLLLKELQQSEKAKIDLQKFKTTKALIRFEGTRNEKTGAFKTFLPELPREQPLVKASWGVNFPSEVELWRPDPEVYHNLFILAWEKFIKPESLKAIKIFKGEQKNRIVWIEKILKATFTDGRKRLIELVILPYLINYRGLPISDAVNITLEWALKNHEKVPIRKDRRNFTLTTLQHYVEYHAKRTARTKLRPLSLDGFQKWFADCPGVLDYVLGKSEQ